MPRVKSNVARLKRKKQVMKAARGAFGGRSKLWKAAKETVERGWRYAYRDRKNKKREFRRLWIVRINAAARLNDLTYNGLINGLKLAGVTLDRKSLSELAIASPAAFASLVKQAKAAAPARPQADPNKVYDIAVGNSPFKGPADAPVVLVEFSDFQ